MKVINLQSYGDFDIPVSQCVLLSDSYTKSDIKKFVKMVEEEFKDTNNPTEAIKFLKKQGFTVIKTMDCTIGGNI